MPYDDSNGKYVVQVPEFISSVAYLQSLFARGLGVEWDFCDGLLKLNPIVWPRITPVLDRRTGSGITEKGVGARSKKEAARIE
jgi:hypothetical protein